MKDLFIALRLFLVMTVITGVLYPLAVTGIGQAAFKDKAEGSLIVKDGKVVGSRLIGQNFDDPKYFWSRPSGTSPQPNNAAASSGSNLGPTNPALKDAIVARVKALRDADPKNTSAVPTDLVTASGSGLDPHISVAAAEYQASRVAMVRQMDQTKVKSLIAECIEKPTFGILGESTVNVLELNLKLDSAK